MPTTTSTQGTQFRTGPSVAQDDANQSDTGGIADTVSTAATAAAPGSATAVLSQGNTSGAVYRLSGGVFISGTAETQLINLKIFSGGTQLAILPTLTGIWVPFGPIRFTSTGTVTVATVAAATAGSIYTAHSELTRVE